MQVPGLLQVQADKRMGHSRGRQQARGRWQARRRGDAGQKDVNGWKAEGRG